MIDEDVSSAIKEIQDAASERILIMTKQWGANVHFMRLWVKYLDALEVSKQKNGVESIWGVKMRKNKKRKEQRGIRKNKMEYEKNEIMKKKIREWEKKKKEWGSSDD